MMLKTLYWENKKNIQTVSNELKNDKVVLGTSDTVVGLFAPCTEKGAQKLDHIKQRKEKPYLILIHSCEQFKNFSSLQSFQLEKIMRAFWPGPLTIIVPAKKELPSFMKSSAGTVALRMPAHKGLLFLLKDFIGLFSTSANITGHEIPHTLADVSSDIKKEVASIIVDRFEHPGIVPSTIIDFSGDSVALVREGMITKTDLEKVLGQKLEGY